MAYLKQCGQTYAAPRCNSHGMYCCKGPTGATGPAGEAGATGPTGSTGGTGADGYTPIITVSGTLTGTPGTQAAVDETVTPEGASLQFTIPAGQTGPTGTAGAPGPTGPTGVTGLAGPTGATGTPGPVGPTGPGGVMGPTGATGPIPTFIAVTETGDPGTAANVNVLQVRDTVDLLFTIPQGPTGPSGEAGEAGPTGAQAMYILGHHSLSGEHAR